MKKAIVCIIAGEMLMIGAFAFHISAILNPTEQNEVHPGEPAIVQKSIIPSHDIPNLTNIPEPFDTISADWSEEDLSGWRHYEIPEECSRDGGYLPDIVQVYTYCLCREKHIDYPMVLAMMEVESGYRYDESSDQGIGYMQIVYPYHKERMDGLTEAALYDPYINIRVAVDYLEELSEQFTSNEEILTAYNSGVSGAYQKYWNKGIFESPYAEKIMEIRSRIILGQETQRMNMQEGD